MDPYQITFQTWNKVAALYQEKFMNLDLYDDTYDRFIGLINKEEAKVLEIGCGPGNITRYLLSKRPDLHIEAIDVAPNMIELARQNVPGVSFRVMDCRDLDKITGRYDAVVCGFALPYLSTEDCAKLFGDCAQLLSAGGVGYFSTIEGDYSQSGYRTASSGDQTYVYFHEETTLKQQLQDAGFQVVDLQRKDYPKEAAKEINLIFIVRRA